MTQRHTLPEFYIAGETIDRTLQFTSRVTGEPLIITDEDAITTELYQGGFRIAGGGRSATIDENDPSQVRFVINTVASARLSGSECLARLHIYIGASFDDVDRHHEIVFKVRKI